MTQKSDKQIAEEIDNISVGIGAVMGLGILIVIFTICWHMASAILVAGTIEFNATVGPLTFMVLNFTLALILSILVRLWVTKFWTKVADRINKRIKEDQ
jgi:hypothetical protein